MITSVLLIVAVIFGAPYDCLWALIVTGIIDCAMWNELCNVIRSKQ